MSEAMKMQITRISNCSLFHHVSWVTCSLLARQRHVGRVIKDPISDPKVVKWSIGWIELRLSDTDSPTN
ncbi:hypothetical protein HanIR_Chr03g0100831 [Helianthus annuus]|nr:hypothetical protein HanIR_Chr03g0100831 [Helianthus annuus]